MKPPKVANTRRPVHAGDLRIEAWAPTRESCLAEAVNALIGSFLGPARPPVSSCSHFHVTGANDSELLHAVLDKVIAAVLERHEVPVATAISATAQGVAVVCDTASAAAVVPVSSIPKGVSRRSALCHQFASGWFCAARIDV
ncbi:MAG TPA: archease [Amycolatopsis sp.]|nr:archease [Amycolatopsis sp.]